MTLRGSRLEISGSCASCARLLAALGRISFRHCNPQKCTCEPAFMVASPRAPAAAPRILQAGRRNQRALCCHGLPSTACSSCARSAIRCPRGFRSSLHGAQRLDLVAKAQNSQNQSTPARIGPFRSSPTHLLQLQTDGAACMPLWCNLQQG